MRASELQRGRVLLIDASWQMPGLLKMFDVSRGPGLYDILSGHMAPKECEPQSISGNLDLLCRGQWNENQPARVLQHLAAEMLSDLKTAYDQAAGF